MSTQPTSHSLPEEFLTKLISEFDDDTVTTMILHGSYARGEAHPPYSDVDIVRITYETAERIQKKQFIWYDGYLLNLSSRPLSIYREWLTIPQEAIFRVSTIRDAHILLDKDGTFHAFQQQTRENWTWEPLQTAANAYAGQLLLKQTEIVLKSLRALFFHDLVALADMMLELFSATTEAVAVQRGIVIRGGNTYFHQVQECVGQNSTWVHYHLRAAGITPPNSPIISIEERGVATLRLYQETVRLLQSQLPTEYWRVISQTCSLIEQILPSEKTF